MRPPLDCFQRGPDQYYWDYYGHGQGPPRPTGPGLPGDPNGYPDYHWDPRYHDYYRQPPGPDGYYGGPPQQCMRGYECWRPPNGPGAPNQTGATAAGGTRSRSGSIGSYSSYSSYSYSCSMSRSASRKGR